MSSERGGLMKTRTESFARHLQSRLKSLSDVEGDSWHTEVSPTSENEVYYSIDSSLASPEEEVAEPIFIAAQNHASLPLERSDSGSQYFDTVENLEDHSPDSAHPALKHIPILHLKTARPTPITNGHMKLLDADSGCSKVLEMPSFELETETCENELLENDHISQFSLENNNTEIDSVEKIDLSPDTELCNVCNGDVIMVEVETKSHMEEQENETSEPEFEFDSTNNSFCVFCDIEQIKTNLSNKSPENNTLHGDAAQDPCEAAEFKTNQEDVYLKVPSNSEENNNSECSSDNEESVPLTDLLQVLKLEISKENEQQNAQQETVISDKCDTPQQSTCPSIEVQECSPEKGSSKEIKEEEEFDIETKRKNFRRCSSLKSGKTPPGTPGRKKIVRFADVLGLDLANVKTYLDEVPTIPKSAYEDLHGIDLSSAVLPDSPFTRVTVLTPQLDKILIPLFQQPSVQPNFLHRVRENNVCLESAYVSDMTLFAISGLVRVKNIDFHKSVYVRYSIDNWRSYSDLQARYVPNSCDGFSDKFTFVLYAHTLNVGQRIEFAIRFHAAGAQYWDGNGGFNYRFECTTQGFSRTYAEPSIPPSPMETWASFY